MPTSKAQREKVARTCECGCGETFYPFPTYRPKSEGGGLQFPKFKRGHHPNTHRKGREPWNKGLTKADNPSVARQGQAGREAPWASWDRVNAALASDPDLRARWISSKRGQIAWNKGRRRKEYPNGIASGPDHGNWKGGHGGIRDTVEYREFRLRVLKRDGYTCQICGDRNHTGRGRRIRLHVDHIEPVCMAPDLALVEANARVLCEPCHRATDTYGSKAARKRRLKS